MGNAVAGDSFSKHTKNRFYLWGCRRTIAAQQIIIVACSAHAGFEISQSDKGQVGKYVCQQNTRYFLDTSVQEIRNIV